MQSSMGTFLSANMDYISFVLLIVAFILGLELFMRRHLSSIGLRGRKATGHEAFHMGRIPLLAGLVITTVIVVGWFWVDQAGREELERNKTVVSGIAPTVAHELQKIGHEKVSLGIRADDRQYKMVVNTMRKMMDIHPDIKNIYTVRRLLTGTNVYMASPGVDLNHDGQISGEREEPTLPGTPVGEDNPQLDAAFHGEQAFEDVPQMHRWGRSIGAFVPIYNEAGRVDSVLGVEYDALKWEQKIAETRRNTMFVLLALFIPLETIYWILFQKQVERFRLGRHQRELEEREDRFRKLSNATFEGIATVEQGQVMEVNQQFARMFRYKPEQMIGLTVRELVDADSRTCLDESDTVHEIYGLRRDGTKFAAEMVGTQCLYQGRDAGVIAIRDITERKQAEEIINHMAYHDHLTGLPNRLKFYDQVTLGIEEAAKSGEQLAVLFLDLDRFKVVNDTLGHSMGDQLLKQVADRITATVRPEDLIARMGGDEFTILMRNIEQTEAAVMAERLNEAISLPYQIEGFELHTTTSIGISLFPQDGDGVHGLMRLADTAMYRAKEAGRHSFAFYCPAMDRQGAERLSLENDLRHALDRDELELFYQPRVDMNSGRIVGMEALLRWRHPELGLVSPGVFIPIAEETGLIVPIGDWVLNTACRQTKAWIDAGYPPLQVAVNLSARQFQRQSLVEKVMATLEETGLDPHFLDLEITESITMQDVEFTSQTLEQLRAFGVQISVDDFGTGYSSLSYLKRFPITTLKIDQSFVRELVNDPYQAAIVNTVIYLAQNLQLKVIAEGVETEEQFNYLRDKSCNEMQGFLFSRPIPAPDFERLLQEHAMQNI
ncbi:MAG TPA: EAL domain-containing protein [Bacilli bacterium]|nr:EAL domain-containing protein [Bacilli bacterium]